MLVFFDTTDKQLKLPMLKSLNIVSSIYTFRRLYRLLFVVDSTVKPLCHKLFGFSGHWFDSELPNPPVLFLESVHFFVLRQCK